MRFTLETYEDLQGPARDLADRVLKVSSDGIGGPFNLLLKSPETGARIVDLLDHFNGGSSAIDGLSRRLAVLILARHSGARYAWWTHRRRALNAGEFTEAQIDALNAKLRPEGLSAALLAVHAYVTALTKGTPTPAPVLATLKAALPEAAVVDLILFCGTYMTVAMILNEADVALPEDEVDTLRRD
ncbi:carboxymuconolactone decarboxylase family protein [Pararhodobacter marinus]|uniref:carboxymuconolactone decarboxylase family protein n=1 Tax=Pararhodobacter marinus TaxID=2184063 RepID=UPI0035153E56